MHVCFVSESYVARDGLAGNAVHDRAKALVAAGLAVSVVTVRRRGQPLRERVDGVEVARLQLDPSRLYIPGFVAGSLSAIREIDRRQKVDVVHAHWATLAGFAGVIASRLFRVSSVVSVKGHDVHYADDQPEYGAYRSRPMRMLVAYTLRSADGVKCISRRLRDWIREGWGISRPDVAVIYPAVSADFLEPSFEPSVRSNGEPFRLLSVGALRGIKRFEDALRALRQLHDAGVGSRYTIVGPDYGEQALLRHLTHELGIEREVELLGHVERERLATIYDRCDAVLAPSVLEGFGMTSLEGMARRKPVIVTSRAGCAEIIEHGRTGFVIPPYAPAAIAECVKRLALERDFGRRVGEAAHDVVRARFTYERWTDEIIRLYEHVRQGG